MKARVIETGEIIPVMKNKNGFWQTGYNGEYWAFDDDELEIIKEDSDIDYWPRLEHQAAIAAMQGILSNHNLYSSVIQTTQVSRVAIDYAHALVEKMKEERK